MNTIDKGWRNWKSESVGGKSKPSQQDGESGGGSSSPAPAKVEVGSLKPSNHLNTGHTRTAKSNVTKPKITKALKLVNPLSDTTSTKLYHKFLRWSDDMEFKNRRDEMQIEKEMRHHKREAMLYNINDSMSPKLFELTMEKLKKRRLSNTLATMVSKIAEDKSGEPIIGNDEWSVPEILNRVLTRVNINSCKQSRERERIIIILDTSPSCAGYSKFFIDIARASANLNDLEMYDAPNAYIVKQYSRLSKKFVKVGLDYAHIMMKWQMFKNRTIIFFGDWDGRKIIYEACKHNTVYWLNPEYSDNYFYCPPYVDTHHYQCRNEEDLIKLIKKMR